MVGVHSNCTRGSNTTGGCLLIVVKNFKKCKQLVAPWRDCIKHGKTSGHMIRKRGYRGNCFGLQVQHQWKWDAGIEVSY